MGWETQPLQVGVQATAYGVCLLLVHCQINANGPARSGLTNPLHVYEYGSVPRVRDLDMSIQAEQWMTCHNLFDEVLGGAVKCQPALAECLTCTLIEDMNPFRYAGHPQCFPDSNVKRHTNSGF